MKKIIIAGGSGFIGSALTKKLKPKYESIVILSRGEPKKEGIVSYVKWDAKSAGAWCNELENADAVINLTGRSVDCRYTEKNKALILHSRVDSTKAIGNAILKCSHPPKTWINGSSAALYGYSYTEPMTENSPLNGNDFQGEVCKVWEKAMDDFNLPQVRKIKLRTSLAFGKEGGVFPVMKRLAQLGAGGKMGDGKQMVSWMHIDDFVNAVAWMLDNANAKGAYNMASPTPLTNEQFMRTLRQQLNVPFGIPSPKWLLEIAAFVIRTETELLLKSRYILPQRLQEEGFRFQFETMEQCAADLVKK